MVSSAPPLVIVENIPDALKTGRQFVGWRYEQRKGQPKPAKMPYTDLAVKGASSTAPADWISFERALAYAEVAGLDGIGRVFVAEDGMVGLDLDNCRDPETGELTPEAADRVKRADTYTEVSPSGTGVKMWMYATLPPLGRKRGDVELYSSARFFTMTGQILPGAPRTVGYRPDFVLALHREVFGDAPDPTTAADDDPERPVPALQLGDEDVIRLASESPHNGQRFRMLWSGDTSGYAVDGNGGRSEALAALVELLVYYGGPDPERVDRLVRRSGLFTEKWERPDIRRRAFDLAMRGRTRFHGDNQVTPASPTVDAPGDGAELMRVRGLLLDRDDLIEYQQSVITKERSERQELAETIRTMFAVMAIPDDQMNARTKLVYMFVGREAASRNSRGVVNLSNVMIAEGTGLPEQAVSNIMQDIPARPGAPFARRVTREWITTESGIQEPRSIAQVAITTEDRSYISVLRAAPEMAGPSDREQKRRQKDRQRTDAQQPWGQCPSGDNDTVAVTGKCPTHGTIVGETIVRREEFDILNPGFRDSDPDSPPVVVQLPIVPESGIQALPPPMYLPGLAGTAEVCDVHGRPLNSLERKRGRCSWCEHGPPATEVIGHGRQVGGERCAQLKRNGRPCTSSMYSTLPGGWLHCLGCGHESAPLAAVAGGSE